jgi:glutaconate CoA-transferase subunit B
VRLPGAGGAPEIATSAKRVCVVMKQSRRAFVDTLSFVTSAGYVDDRIDNPRAQGRGPTTVITDLGIMNSDPQTRELTLVAVHPGFTIGQVEAETGWTLKINREVACTPPPERHELEALRDLQARTAAAHGVANGSE